MHNLKVLIAAGGTGGHIIPAIAVAEALCAENKQAEIVFVGVGREIEEKLIGGAGFPLKVVPFVPVLGKGGLGLLKLLTRFPMAFLECISLFRTEKPDVVIAFGGYPSFMPILTSCLFGIPRLLHEQNVQVGLANKVLSLFTRRIFAVKGASGFFRQKDVRHLPNPVRKSFYEIPDWKKPRDGQAYNILVVGGSQGAVTLNTAVLDAAAKLSSDPVELVHQAGERDSERVSEAYRSNSFDNARVLSFIDDIASEYEKAHLVICRAGAMTVAEVSASGRPAIFLPLPIAAGHQGENARYLTEAGAAELIEQNEEASDKLALRIRELISKPERLEEMASNARRCAGSTSENRAANILAQAVLSELK